ncbi:MAG: alpha-amylase [Magnetococcales bacterium]|nr:alpha-amylase [Magnetococcales bacterium]
MSAPTLRILDPKKPRRLVDLSLEATSSMSSSPSDWRDQFFYFLLPDRFSDGREHAANRPLFDRHHPTHARIRDRAAWIGAARRCNGGTLSGIRSKLDYLQNLGISTLWLGPIWKQRRETLGDFGYGIQNFLEVDPRFGSVADLRVLADSVHERGMYLILDIILTHTGNNWFYRDEHGQGRDSMPFKETRYEFAGWRNAQGECVPKIMDADAGVWPEELQDPSWYTRNGCMEMSGNRATTEPALERGDLADLKELDLHQEQILTAMIRLWCHWIVRSDCDGFRIDTLRPLPPEVTHRFCAEIRQFAGSLGKEEFLLLGEGKQQPGAPWHGMAETQDLADAVLDHGELVENLDELLAGNLHPQRFFAMFDNPAHASGVAGGGRYRVMFLDHRDLDISAGTASREERYQRLAQAEGVLLTLPCLPALHFGAEQALLSGGSGVPGLGSGRDGADRFQREAMFGGPFGPFETEGCHFFDTTHPTYLRTALIGRLRTGGDGVGLALRRGQFFPRETSVLHGPFIIHDAGELMAWSRLFRNQEVLVVINTHTHQIRGAEITIDAGLHPPGSTLRYLYRSDWSPEALRDPQQAAESQPNHENVSERHGRAIVHLSLPPNGMALLT